MANWDDQTSPFSKLEDSPAESFVSTPGDMYPPLFPESAPAPVPSTMNPIEMMTPPSAAEDSKADAAMLSALTSTVSPSTPAAPDTPGTVGTPERDTESTGTEKKTVKKRKSWGQVLPEPKTNLPPRKRAKTEDEKEQRRVERVLRNRRAAQSSRERKRQEVEALEKRNKELEARLLDVEKANLMLVEELHKFRRSNGVVMRSPSPLDSLHSNPVTFSQELFSSQDGHKPLVDAKSALFSDFVVGQPSNATVDPSSLSPEPSPSPEEAESNTNQADSKMPASTTTTGAGEAFSTETSSTDLTQRPAAMLCDLQCHQSEDLARSLTASLPSLSLASFLQLQMLLLVSSTVVSICQRPLTQIALSLKAGFSLQPAPSILNTIIWLVTRPRSSRRTHSTSHRSSMRTATEPHLTPRRPTGCPSQRMPTSASTLPTLRIHSLQKILTCSPNLARPLQDATMEALRLVSEGCDDRVSNSTATERSTRREGSSTPPRWQDGLRPPSKEALLTLMWALKVEARKRKKQEQQAVSFSDPDLHNQAPTRKCVLEIVSGGSGGMKRSMAGVAAREDMRKKRKRLG